MVLAKLQLPVSGEKVLDVGCYDGYLLSKISAEKKVGIDISPIPRYPDVEYIQGDFLEYDFGEERFDKIFAMDVLEHVDHDGLFVEKLVNLLSENGIAIMSVPSKGISVFPAFLQEWVDKKWGHYYRRGYTQLEIKNLYDNLPCNLNIEFQTWNCPIFRILYFPLSIMWRILPSFTSGLMKYIVRFDFKHKDGNSGYLYWTVYKRGSNSNSKKLKDESCYIDNRHRTSQDQLWRRCS